METGLAPGTEQSKAARERHLPAIDTWFYPCSVEMQKQLAEIYVSDSRFTSQNESQRANLAQFIRNAIHLI